MGDFLSAPGRPPTPMRVALVAEETAHRRPTAGRERLRWLARRLADRGHEVAVLCTQWWDGMAVTRTVEGVTYHGVTVAPATTSFHARLPALLARYDPDVVGALPVPTSGLVAAGAGARLAGAPLVLDWFGDEPVPASRTAALGLRLADLVVAPSRYVRTRPLERGVDEADTAVVPEAVDCDRVRATEPAAGADVAVASALDADANVDDVLLALAELRDRDWTAVVFGDGPERPAAERQAAELQIDDRVRFAGETDRDTRVATYRGAHVFVHAADRTCFATELLWALAAGCVGVVEFQPDSAAHELVETRDRGFRVAAPEEIADAIVDAGDLPELDYDPTLEAYDEPAVLDRWLEAYRDVAGLTPAR